MGLDLIYKNWSFEILFIINSPSDYLGLYKLFLLIKQSAKRPKFCVLGIYYFSQNVNEHWHIMDYVLVKLDKP